VADKRTSWCISGRSTVAGLCLDYNLPSCGGFGVQPKIDSPLKKKTVKKELIKTK